MVYFIYVFNFPPCISIFFRQLSLICEFTHFIPTIQQTKPTKPYIFHHQPTLPDYLRVLSQKLINECLLRKSFNTRKKTDILKVY